MKKIFSFVFASLMSVALFADDTYTVVGENTDIFGEAWKETRAANDMTLDGSVYKWTKTGVTLPVGSYAYKIVKNHAWTTSYPQDGNDFFSISESGKYDLTFMLDLSAATPQSVKAELKENIPMTITVEAKGSWDSWASGLAFAEAADHKSASATKNLSAGDYEFKILLNGTAWRANGHEYHAGYPGAENINVNGDNMKLKAEVAGDYTFTWTFATDGLMITFPTGTAVENVQSDKVQCTKVVRDGQLYIIKNGETYTTQGQLVK